MEYESLEILLETFVESYMSTVLTTSTHEKFEELSEEEESPGRPDAPSHQPEYYA
jgi:hypothetical protein